MSFPYDSTTLTAISNCTSLYNGNAYNSGTNPGGMAAGGHRVNFIPALRDVSTIASSVADAANSASTAASAASSSATTALNASTALSGTSTTSVAIGTGAKSFTTQAGKAFDVGTFVIVESSANPTVNFMSGQVTAYDAGTGALTVNVVVSSGSGAHTDWIILGRTGSPGIQGPTGSTGPQGETPAFQWTFGTGTADVDPGNGIVQLNNATPSSVTTIFFDNLDRFGSTLTTWLDSLDDSTNTASRGTLFLQQVGSGAIHSIYTVTGTVVNGTGYRKVSVTYVTSNGTFSGGSNIAVTFVRTGDKGVDGTGAGDTISDIASVTDGRIVLFNGVSGKHITNAAVGIGTSGANLGALNTGNTWSAQQSFAAKIDAQQDFAWSGDLTPASITANQNDYNPTGWSTNTILRLTTDASTRTLTGLAAGADGRLAVLTNVGGTFDLIVANQNASSSAANRFLMGADVAVGQSCSIAFLYDNTQTRWVPITFTGLYADGSQSRPMYSFVNDPDTGMYRIGTNNLGLSAGGTKVVDLNTVGASLPGVPSAATAAAGTSTTQLATTAFVQQEISSGAWTNYTPTVTMQSGGGYAFTSTNGWYQKFGKVCHVFLKIVFSAIGTGSGFVQATLPPSISAAREAMGVAMDTTNTGKMSLVWLDQPNALFKIRQYDTTTAGSSAATILASITFETT